MPACVRSLCLISGDSRSQELYRRKGDQEAKGVFTAPVVCTTDVYWTLFALLFTTRSAVPPHVTRKREDDVDVVSSCRRAPAKRNGDRSQGL